MQVSGTPGSSHSENACPSPTGSSWRRVSPRHRPKHVVGERFDDERSGIELENEVEPTGRCVPQREKDRDFDRVAGESRGVPKIGPKSEVRRWRRRWRRFLVSEDADLSVVKDRGLVLPVLGVDDAVHEARKRRVRLKSVPIDSSGWAVRIERRGARHDQAEGDDVATWRVRTDSKMDRRQIEPLAERHSEVFERSIGVVEVAARTGSLEADRDPVDSPRRRIRIAAAEATATPLIHPTVLLVREEGRRPLFVDPENPRRYRGGIPWTS